MDWEPKIVGFLCNWCSYRGADLAGISRLKFAPNVKVIRVPCSARVEPAFVLKAFQSGADGVLILGCHPGDCHYNEGNYKTMRRVPLLKKMLSQLGVESDRVALDWVSASEGEKFASVVNTMTEKVRALGPLNMKNFEEFEHGNEEELAGGKAEVLEYAKT
ncbi:MAG: hydrogenase iron-sulfur subunit [Dehalococcoidia bacterium]|jgi:F420-non-reducing hydrogenase iron-sulfur subunit